MTTRGIRNNNPGNIDRHEGVVWVGMSSEQTDPRFIVFRTPEYGIRALAKTLLTYQAKYKLDTIREVIGRWAPPVENDTGAYAEHVAELLGVSEDSRISLSDPGTLTAITEAIIAHENAGYRYPADVVARGIGMALNKTTEDVNA